MPTITFQPINDIASELLEPPKPAAGFVPEWYRKMPPYIEDDTTAGISVGNNSQPNTTAKGCSPFLDALTAGYVWAAPADIEVRRKDDNYMFRWRTEGDFVTAHSPNPHPGRPAMQDGGDWVMKWAFHFKIITPEGYSTLFTHPHNRHDLPFRTFTGIVDTDSYQLAVQFPFQFSNTVIENDDIYIIEKGTPLCQMTPFKRDEWVSEEAELDLADTRKSVFDFRTKIVRSYKSQFWTRKVFS